MGRCHPKIVKRVDRIDQHRLHRSPFETWALGPFPTLHFGDLLEGAGRGCVAWVGGYRYCRNKEKSRFVLVLLRWYSVFAFVT